MEFSVLSKSQLNAEYVDLLQYNLTDRGSIAVF
jgi:hypothetical protein